MRTLLLAVLVVAFPLFADHDHKDHQVDLGNIGKAHIDTSCNEAAQKEIDRGVALIHSFWYGEAEKAFRRAAAADAECGMAWWGVAMSNLHPIWAPPTENELKVGVEAAAKAKQVGAKTDREKGYINAIATYFSDVESRDHKTRMNAYEKAMADLATANAKDREAAIFHALAILGIADAKDKTYAQQKRAAAILNRVLPEEPEHPGVAHYLIHSLDYPELAELALPAARVYARLAPGSPHALHMPSHIFTRLGLWDESIASNIASRDKAAAYVAKMMPGAAASDELHAIDYLVYAYLQQGKFDEAKKLVDRIAAVKKIDNPDHFAAAYALSAAPGRYALERRQWKEAMAVQVPPILEWSKVPYAQANVHFVRAIGAARAGEIALARGEVASLAALKNMVEGYWADQIEIQRLGALAWLRHAEQKDEDALKFARAAADLEASTEKHPVTPGAIIPARELLAELLAELGKPNDALEQIKLVLKDAPKKRSAMQLQAELLKKQ